MEKVILVNKKDKVIGVEEKMKAHLQGKLHRAFSIILFNKKGEVLIQKRAKSKYHSAGLWTNTCCSHPRPKEKIDQAAKRRLKEEMGIETDLKKIFSFIYKAKLGSLVEYEFDHVFFGRFNGKPKPNEKEVEDWQWIKLADLKTDIAKNPQKYTPWFKIIFEKINRVRNLPL
ncbi:MAG: isopentenyl-diphosphate delta-isomerase [Candidatus Nealsonbacteria bacterium CG10_big_fil_rev_8_21_14_0_10_37_25]|uniref:Isopentenyl-diphosphate delta-isomerase n=1 Tax=Candidatus Nealsonbacteria bacterium CG10_big_fil_rev_8_21_14_0_10_37_25 TaxID=1974711 RepID=A0A2H0TIP2_9BACT|nr:MAG: isopentenyl-diphosphate delta-isomerase [Candidatus Nealsonbacteria bacterium CG10_big_fil_rev_8_21_14_0_10_37_25]